MLDINENTRLLFLKAVNEINENLKHYASRADANEDYVKKQNQRLQDIFNFYNEVETVLQNRKFNRDVFVFNESPATAKAEIYKLKAEIKHLRNQLYGGGYSRADVYFDPQARENYRSWHNDKQRSIYGY
jgi:predicted  nucleic acid-binding Zn-ribbon protein